MQGYDTRRWSLCVIPVIVLLALWAAFSFLDRPWQDSSNNYSPRVFSKPELEYVKNRNTTAATTTHSLSAADPDDPPEFDILQEMGCVNDTLSRVLDLLDERTFKNPKSAEVKQVLKLYLRLHSYLGINRLIPFDLNFGLSRGGTIGRHILLNTLVPFVKKGNYLKGPRCMEWDILYTKHFSDVCTEPYNFQYPRHKCGGKQGKFLEKNGKGFCGDVHKADKAIPANYLDSVLATQVFEHLHDPFKAIKQIYRILKPGGVLLWTAPFISIFHAVPDDYFRYTVRGASHLIQSAGFCVKVAKGMSSTFLAASELMGLSSKDFSQEILEMETDDIAPLFVLVIAEKPLEGQKCETQNVPSAVDLDHLRKNWVKERGKKKLGNHTR